AVIGLISFIANMIFVPSDLTEYDQVPMSEQLKVFKTPSLLLVYIITALGYGGTFVVYTYLTTLLTESMGYGESAVVV
ncbi:MFS transporter, partial [Vibrio cholerae O1]|nr:MFS transporter [Vibrio cholerae O1]